jgi:hypothetical protein
MLRNLVAGKEPWPLYLHGPSGTGKTCAGLCLIDFAGGDYYTVADLHDTVIRAQQGRLIYRNLGHAGTIWPSGLWGQIAQAPLVVLDELGCRERVSDAHYETVKRCIDARHNKPFVVISNLAIAEVGAVYDDRIFSRLGAGTVLELAGPDRRLLD